MSQIEYGAHYVDHETEIGRQEDIPGRALRHPAPGAESVGPALVDFVQELRRTTAGLEALYSQARLEAMYRTQRGVAQGQTDSNGDLVLPLFTVPGGCTGYLMYAAIDEAGVTPAAPDTNANLWHAIYAAAAPLATRQADVVAVGQLLDFQLTAATAGDAKIPDVYRYSDKVGAPSIHGPLTFYLVVDAATAARQVAVRYAVLVEQPE